MAHGQMDDEDLAAQQVTRLLHLGLGPGESATVADANDRKADRLYELLANPLPVEASVVNSLPDALQPLSQKLTSVAGEALKDLLLSRETSISTLKRVKDFARQLGSGEESEIKYDVALAVYYAAIAAAMVYHGQRITSYSYADLAKSFASLAGQNWPGEELVRLYAGAHKLCTTKSTRLQDRGGNNRDRTTR